MTSDSCAVSNPADLDVREVLSSLLTQSEIVTNTLSAHHPAKALIQRWAAAAVGLATRVAELEAAQSGDGFTDDPLKGAPIHEFGDMDV